MSNRYKKREVYQEPLYYRPSKAVRQSNNYSLSDTTVFLKRYYDNPTDMESNKHNIKYDSDFEYENDYDYVSDESYYDYYDQDNKDHRRYYYENSFRKTPYYTKQYVSSETETLNEDDSYSGYSQRGVLRRRRGSDITYEEQDPRLGKYFRVLRRGESRYPSDTERVYDSDPYVVRQRRAHHVYRPRRQRSRGLQPSYDGSNTYTLQTSEDSDLSITRSQTANQVYMTNPVSDNTAFSRERIISVIDYDESLKQKPKDNEDIKGNSSELLYVPVIFQNGKTNSEQEISSPKLSLKHQKKEGKEQNNIEVFVATNLEQENIFDHSDNKPAAKYARKTISKTRKKSNTSTANKRLSGTKSKMDESEAGYPVQKSYIKVAPNGRRSRIKSLLHISKDSKSSIQTLESKKQSEDNMYQNEDNKDSRVQQYNQHLKKNKGQIKKSLSFNNNNKEDVLAGSSMYDNRSHDEEILQTVGVRETQKSKSENSEQKSGILAHHLESQVKEESEKASGSLGKSKISHQGHHKTFTTTKKNKNSEDELSTEVWVDQKRNNVSHTNSMVKDSRKSENAAAKKGSNEVTDRRKSAIGNGSQKSSFVENLRTSEVSGFQRNSNINDNRDYENNTNQDNSKNNANNKHQRFNNIVHLREIPSNSKQHSLNRASGASTRQTFRESEKHSTVKQSLSETFPPDDVEHSRKSAASDKSRIRNTEQSQKTHDFEKKSSTSILSKRDNQPSTQKVNHERSTKEHLTMTEPITRKKNDRKENSNDLPQDSADTTDSYQPSQYSRRQTEPGRLSESPGTSNHSLSLWGYDLTPLVNVFQVAQFFLGLTMHDKLMEVINHYYKN